MARFTVKITACKSETTDYNMAQNYNKNNTFKSIVDICITLCDVFDLSKALCKVSAIQILYCHHNNHTFRNGWADKTSVFMYVCESKEGS